MRRTFQRKKMQLHMYHILAGSFAEEPHRKRGNTLFSYAVRRQKSQTKCDTYEKLYKKIV